MCVASGDGQGELRGLQMVDLFRQNLRRTKQTIVVPVGSSDHSGVYHFMGEKDGVYTQVV